MPRNIQPQNCLAVPENLYCDHHELFKTDFVDGNLGERLPVALLAPVIFLGLVFEDDDFFGLAMTEYLGSYSGILHIWSAYPQSRAVADSQYLRKGYSIA